MTSSGLGWLYALPLILLALAFFAVLIVLARKWHQFPRPTLFAIAGIVSLFIGKILSMMLMGSGDLAAAALASVGICLFLVAVYIDRDTNSTS